MAKTSKSSPSSVSFWTKAGLLLLLAVQNGMLTLCARWSRVIASSPANDEDGGVPAIGYAKTTLVVVTEALKIGVAFLLLALDRGDGVQEAWQHLASSTWQQPREVAKLLVPSSLYVLQNNLVLVSAENLEGPIMAVLGQLKILTTAMFSVTLLGRSLGFKQWVALALLVSGVSAVQLSTQTHHGGGGSSSATQGDGGTRNATLGVGASVLAALCSGFAGVYFEKVLKGSDLSVWVRNIHLAFFGVGVALFGMCTQANDLRQVTEQGFFAGYNSVVWALVGVQAGGGLLVAAVVKYTDNILKAFATSAALVAVSVISVLFFNFPISSLFVAGAALVVYSMFLYGDLVHAALLPPGLSVCESALTPKEKTHPEDNDEEASSSLLHRSHGAGGRSSGDLLEREASGEVD